ncbi:MAG: SCO family protein [Gammaproteobacteria bacterium]|nr:SCO family protein [Gammaproteobacteria bacterium]MDE0412614.1 SCO family protein [Gammaproteobacteria bacterium]
MLRYFLRIYLFFVLALCIASGSAENRNLGGNFKLTTHWNEPYTLSSSKGQVVLLFFGFTNCPDVCPHTLGTIKSVLTQLGKRASHVQPLFISVDPERDTPETLANYLEYFGNRFIGLTGSTKEIDTVVKQFSGFYYTRGENLPEAPYSIDHTSNLYVIDTDGKVASILPYGTPLQILLKNIETLIPSTQHH